MTSEEEYYKALKFAAAAHGEQKDLDGLPYILHPARVAESFIQIKAWDLAVAAVLHDVVEDTDVTLEEIRKEFGDTVATIVDNVSRRGDETYAEFIDRAAKHAPSSLVKLADIRDNLYRRGKIPSGMEKRYLKAISTLTKAHQISYYKCECCDK